MNTELKKEKIAGQEVTFYCTDEGTFVATTPVLDGDWIRGKTLVECRNKISATLRRLAVKLGIKASYINLRRPDLRKKASWQLSHEDSEAPTDHVEAILLTGINAHTHRTMFVIESTGEKDESGRSGNWMRDDPIITRRLTPAEIATYKKLYTARDAAQKAFAAFVDSVKIDRVDEFVAAEVEKRFEEQSTTDEETGDPRIDVAPKKKGVHRARARV